MAGCAFDVARTGWDEAEFIREARKAGFNGIGIYSKHIHVDIRKTFTTWTR